jgi:putative transposase
LVSYGRRPRFAYPADLQRLREAIASVQREQPFRFLAGVVLPNHMHFVWTLPVGDADYSRRIGRMKVHFTRSFRTPSSSQFDGSLSRRKHRESDVWQRRFWEQTIDDEGELGAFLDYIHYNPVKHHLASCPHAWPASSFSRWVALGLYEKSWGCGCRAGRASMRDFRDIENRVGEP